MIKLGKNLKYLKEHSQVERAIEERKLKYYVDNSGVKPVVRRIDYDDEEELYYVIDNYFLCIVSASFEEEVNPDDQ